MKYRLLNDGDVIESGDEFLDDDCETWISVPIDGKKTVGASWMIGVTWKREGILKPFRRLIRRLE